MSPAGVRLLLSGYYGFDNFGDEAILQVFVEQWRSRRPQDSVRALSATPSATSAAFGIEAVPRASVPRVQEALRDNDVFISGGGGLLQSSTSLRSLLYYAGLLHEAKAAGNRTVIFAQGIGPLSFTGKHVVRRSCAGVDLAIVRDDASAELLRQLLPKVEIRVGADPVFLTSDGETAGAEQTLRGEGIPESGDVVAVVVRPARVLDRIGDEIARAVDLLTSQHRAQVVFVPFQLPADVEAAVSIIRRCRTAPVLLGGGYSLAAMTALLRRCTAVVGMRLHALILASRLGVPFVAVPYDPKIVALTESLRYPIPPLQSGNAQEIISMLWERRGALREHLVREAAPLMRKASDAFDWLQALVEGAVS